MSGSADTSDSSDVSAAAEAAKAAKEDRAGEHSEHPVIVFTDGACRGNPGPGGWAALIRTDCSERMINGAEADTTNNRMELLAAIEGLLAVAEGSHIHLTTDSQYVRQGITQWITGWKRNGWKTAARKPVKNQDLWQRLDAAVEERNVRWFWVKGHSGHPDNEAVDEGANLAIDALLAER